MWHVVFAEPGRMPQSRAARSRDAAIHIACELLAQSYDVRRIVEPNGTTIERGELDGHYAEGGFPGLHPREGGSRATIDTPELPLLSCSDQTPRENMALFTPLMAVDKVHRARTRPSR